MRRRSKAAGCVLMVGIGAGAQQAKIPEWPRVRVNVSIVDKNGKPVAGVKADDLTVTDDKTVVHGAVVSPVGDEPASVCLLVDASGSTYDTLDTIRAEVKEFFSRLPARDEVCLMDYSTSLHLDAGFTANGAAAADGLKYLKPWGGSALLDAVVSTAQWMEKQAKNPERVLVVVSDGGENASKSSEEAVRRELQRPEAPVLYSFINSLSGDGPNRADETRLRRLTEDTGGLAILVKKKNSASQAADELAQATSGRYELEFTASNPAADGSERKLRVEPSSDLRKQKIKVVGPDGYIAARQ